MLPFIEDSTDIRQYSLTSKRRLQPVRENLAQFDNQPK